jgi:hypothetical protein
MAATLRIRALPITLAIGALALSGCGGAGNDSDYKAVNVKGHRMVLRWAKKRDFDAYMTRTDLQHFKVADLGNAARELEVFMLLKTRAQYSPDGTGVDPNDATAECDAAGRLRFRCTLTANPDGQGTGIVRSEDDNGAAAVDVPLASDGRVTDVDVITAFDNSDDIGSGGAADSASSDDGSGSSDYDADAPVDQGAGDDSSAADADPSSSTAPALGDGRVLVQQGGVSAWDGQPEELCFSASCDLAGEGLSWSGWGAPTATGTGTIYARDQGREVTVHGSIDLDGLRRCNGRAYYTHAVIRHDAPLPFDADEQRPSTPCAESG